MSSMSLAPSAQRIVVIEDDSAIAGATVRGLRQAGFMVELATSGPEGLSRATALTTALVVLDLMLPELDGIDVLRGIRSRCATPVIVISARTDLATRVGVFELGAVDYLPKPFFIEELLARVHARLGSPLPALAERPRFGALTVDFEARDARINDTQVGLTRSEFTVLAHLVRRPGRVVARHELAAILDTSDEVGARNVDVHVARLRKKLGDAAGHIATVWGSGYRFLPERQP